MAFIATGTIQLVRLCEKKLFVASIDCHNCYPNESTALRYFESSYWIIFLWLYQLTLIIKMNRNQCSKSCWIIKTIHVKLSKLIRWIFEVIFYSTSIFSNAGLKDQWPVYCTILLGVVQVIMTFVCMVIIDKAGRKILLLIGMIGMCISAFGLATASILSKVKDILSAFNNLI